MPSRSHLPQAILQSQQTVWTVPCHLVLAFCLLPLEIFLLRQGSSLTSRLIGEPLADYAFKQFVRALGIVYAKLNTVVVPEVELSEVTV